jgi:uncharacterized repeat protein (TIGR03803 family)
MRNSSASQVRLLILTLSIAILPATASAQVYKQLFSFNSTSVGIYANGSLVFDSAGNLYGTTQSGGPSCSTDSDGCGLVFELSPSGGGWSETILHAFTGTDGSTPTAGVVFDSKGNLYGTTTNGGAYNKGAVFELSPTTSGWRSRFSTASPAPATDMIRITASFWMPKEMFTEPRPWADRTIRASCFS